MGMKKKIVKPALGFTIFIIHYYIIVVYSTMVISSTKCLAPANFSMMKRQ